MVSAPGPSCFRMVYAAKSRRGWSVRVMTSSFSRGSESSSRPENPNSAARIALLSASRKVRPIARLSPTLFIWVPSSS